jgi:ABC-type bacteriocin/lantibiotic exporter with double-glycine peptidase domain
LGIGIYLFVLKKQSPISPINPNELTIPAIKVDFYSQGDLRWQNKKLGPSKDTMSSVGCTICCMAMAISTKQLHLLPDELNDKLLANDGFTNSGLIKWEKSKPAIGFEVGPTPNYHQNITNSLKAGNPVITKIFLHGRVQHWVLIVGMKKGRYLIADPLEDQFSEKFIDRLTDKIYAIRTIK